jgi:hypothetical protein
MKDVRFITRSDDAGSSVSANEAIRKVIRAGFIKNVSLMAVGGKIEDAAERLLPLKKKICFGIHSVLNAEWDKVKWGPLSPMDSSGGLVDDRGYFLADPSLFEKTKPDIALILREYDAQLDKLTRLHFPITYVDSHMLPEKNIPGLMEAMNNWIETKGLVNHIYFYNLPPGFEKIAADPKKLVPVLRAIPEGQYFYISHPALYSEEMLLTGNSSGSGEAVARARSGEAALLSNPFLPLLMRFLSIRPIRYDEAVPGASLDLKNLPF